MEPDMTKVKMPKVLTKFPASGTFWVGTEGSIFKLRSASLRAA